VALLDGVPPAHQHVYARAGGYVDETMRRDWQPVARRPNGSADLNGTAWRFSGLPVGSTQSARHPAATSAGPQRPHYHPNRNGRVGPRQGHLRGKGTRSGAAAGRLSRAESGPSHRAQRPRSAWRLQALGTRLTAPGSKSRFRCPRPWSRCLVANRWVVAGSSPSRCCHPPDRPHSMIGRISGKYR
jgi:hypothetical protein